MASHPSPVGINQGDYLYFYDLSVGNVVTRDWYFPGGIPGASEEFAPIVQYLSPNQAGFSVTLTISDGVLTASVTERNLVIVYPESASTIQLTISQVNNPADMSSEVTYTISGSTGSGLSYYTWNIPGVGGFTGTSNTYGVTLDDWGVLTGSEFGSVYSTYQGTAQASITTVLGNTFSTSKPITYNKSGVEEYLNLCDYPLTTSIHNISYFDIQPIAYYDDVTYEPGITVYRLTNEISMSGSGIVLQVFQTPVPGDDPIFDNTSLHAQGENMTFYSPSWDIRGDQGGAINGQVVASYSAFSTLGITGGVVSNVQHLSRYYQGNYMKPYDIGDKQNYRFYFADTDNELVNTTLNRFGRYWSQDAVKAYLNDTSFASVSSRSWETGSITLPGIIDHTSDYAGFATLYGGPGVPFDGNHNVTLTIQYYGSSSRDLLGSTLLATHNIPLGTGGIGDRGNSPARTFLLAQDTGYGPGIATKLNAWFSANNLSPYMGATASPYFATFEDAQARNGGVWPNSPAPGVEYAFPQDFNGIRISILDDYIDSHRGTRPFGLSSNKYLTEIILSGTAYNPDQRTTYDIAAWLGLARTTITNPYWGLTNDEPRRGFYFNG
jgi:hypothetical protein